MPIAFPAAALITAGASIYGANKQASAAQQAANTQTTAANQAAELEAKAAEKLEALNTAIEELKSKDADAQKVASRLEVTIKALDLLQTRVKATGLSKDPIYQTETKSFGEMLAPRRAERLAARRCFELLVVGIAFFCRHRLHH